MLDVLISAESNISDKSEKGWTSLLNLVIKHDHTGTVEALLNIEGIKVDERNEHKFTQLYNAVHKDHKEIVEVLLEKRANVNAVNTHGMIHLDYANGKNVEVILKAGEHSFVKAFNKGIATAIKTALLGAAIATVLFATETIAILIAIAVVAIIAAALAVDGATYMILKLSNKVDGVEKHQS